MQFKNQFTNGYWNLTNQLQFSSWSLLLKILVLERKVIVNTACSENKRTSSCVCVIYKTYFEWKWYRNLLTENSNKSPGFMIFPEVKEASVLWDCSLLTAMDKKHLILQGHCERKNLPSISYPSPVSTIGQEQNLIHGTWGKTSPSAWYVGWNRDRLIVVCFKYGSLKGQ